MSHFSVLMMFIFFYLGFMVLQWVAVEAKELETITVRTDLRWGPGTR